MAVSVHLLSLDQVWVTCCLDEMTNEALGFPNHQFRTQNSFFFFFGSLKDPNPADAITLVLFVLIKLHLVLIRNEHLRELSTEEIDTCLKLIKRNQELLCDKRTTWISLAFSRIRKDRLQICRYLFSMCLLLFRVVGIFLSLQNYFLQEQKNQNMFSPQWIFMAPKSSSILLHV